ncbi:hypothetical protein ACJX0J_026910, partial [Zea mays]
WLPKPLDCMELIIALKIQKLHISYLLLEAINIEYAFINYFCVSLEKNSAVELNNKLRQELAVPHWIFLLIMQTLLHFCTYHFQIISCVQKWIIVYKNINTKCQKNCTTMTGSPSASKLARNNKYHYDIMIEEIGKEDLWIL